MSFLQAPEFIHHQEPSCKGSVFSTTFFHDHGTLREEENIMTSQSVERFVQHKLSTYQAAAVVSTVLAGVESQLLVFLKLSPDSLQQSPPVTLQCLLALTYIALIFSVSSTISSLVLTRDLGKTPFLTKIRGTAEPKFESLPCRTGLSGGVAPRRWRWTERHWLFALVLSMMCLPAQIFLYIWTHERDAIWIVISVVGVFAMLPLLHFLPRPSRSTQDKVRFIAPPFSRGKRPENSSPGDPILRATFPLSQ